MNPPSLEIARKAYARFVRCKRVSAMPKELAQAFLTERSSRIRLRKRSALEWLEAIQMIPEPNRCWCACMIWFDYCSEWRPEESDIFYELYLDHWTKHDLSTREQLMQGLRTAGYTPLMAEQRVPLEINNPSESYQTDESRGDLCALLPHTLAAGFELELA